MVPPHPPQFMLHPCFASLAAEMSVGWFSIHPLKIVNSLERESSNRKDTLYETDTNHRDIFPAPFKPFLILKFMREMHKSWFPLLSFIQDCFYLILCIDEHVTVSNSSAPSPKFFLPLLKTAAATAMDAFRGWSWFFWFLPSKRSKLLSKEKWPFCLKTQCPNVLHGFIVLYAWSKRHFLSDALHKLANSWLLRPPNKIQATLPGLYPASFKGQLATHTSIEPCEMSLDVAGSCLSTLLSMRRGYSPGWYIYTLLRIPSLLEHPSSCQAGQDLHQLQLWSLY